MEVLDRTENGLKREYKIFVSPEEVEEALIEKLKEQAAKTRMDGFRPGKVPVDVIRRMYGETLKQEAVRDLISKTSKKIINDEKLSISFDFATSITKEDDKGVEYALRFELVPHIEVKEFSNLELVKHVAEIDDEEVTKVFDTIRLTHKNWVDEPEKTVVKEGHKVSVDLMAKMKMKKRDSHVANSLDILVGDPGVMEDFWKPLIGKKAGDVVDFVVSYPKGIKDKNLAGKKIEYSATVKKVMKSEEFKLDDVFAKSVGYENFDKLHEWAKGQVVARYDNMSTEILKRDLLEKMSTMYDFEVPSNMFEIEFGEVKRQIGEEARKLGREMDENIEKECKKIAMDRVRLGFVVAEISKKEKIAVSKEEIATEINHIAAMYPGHEKAIWNTYSHGAALNAVVGPILERKVVDHILSFVKIKEKPCTIKQLVEIDEEPFDFFKDDAKAKKTEHKTKAEKGEHTGKTEKTTKSSEKSEKSKKSEEKKSEEKADGAKKEGASKKPRKKKTEK